MYKYIETDVDGSRITANISARSEAEMLRKLKRHFASAYDEDPFEAEIARAIRSARTLEELGEQVDFTRGWGENNIKVGHLLEEGPTGFRQIW